MKHYRDDYVLGGGQITESFLELIYGAPGGCHLLGYYVRVVSAHGRVQPLLQAIRPLHTHLVQLQEWRQFIRHL